MFFSVMWLHLFYSTHTPGDKFLFCKKTLRTWNYWGQSYGPLWFLQGQGNVAARRFIFTGVLLSIVSLVQNVLFQCIKIRYKEHFEITCKIITNNLYKFSPLFLRKATIPRSECHQYLQWGGEAVNLRVQFHLSEHQRSQHTRYQGNSWEASREPWKQSYKMCIRFA